MTEVSRNFENVLTGIKSAVLPAVLIAGSLFNPVSAQAANGDAGEINSMSFSVWNNGSSVVRVGSSDGKKWDTLETDWMKGTYHVAVNTKWPGYVKYLRLWLGKCTPNTECNEAGEIYTTGHRNRDVEKESMFILDVDNVDFFGKAHVSPGGPTYKKAILDTCNTFGLQNGQANKEYSFNYDLVLTMGTVVEDQWGPLGRLEHPPLAWEAPGPTHMRTDTFKIHVVCEPTELEPVNVAEPEPEPRVTEKVKLFLSTFSHAISKPKAGVQCKKGRVLIRAKTDKVGKVRLSLRTKLGDGPTKKEMLEVNAKLNSDGIPEAEIKKWFTTTETTILKAKVVPAINAGGNTTNWKELPLNCSAPGGGGWAQPDAPDDGVPDPVANNTGIEGAPSSASVLPVKGELSLMDKSKTGHGVPRNATAFILMSSNEPTSRKYNLKCSGNRNWSGLIKPAKVGVGQYAYARTHVFPIEETEFVKCILRFPMEQGYQVLDTAERTYSVYKPGKRPKGKPNTGNMTQQSGPNVGDDPIDRPMKLESEVTLLDNSANAPSKKARYGLVSILATANQPGSVTYKLRCGKGREWSGKLSAKKISMGNYRYARSHTFPIKKTKTVKCILRVKAKKGLPDRSTTRREYIVM
ncbi:MAG: hypothetical protein ABJN40_02775 [Sneathiella sp.]